MVFGTHQTSWGWVAITGSDLISPGDISSLLACSLSFSLFISTTHSSPPPLYDFCWLQREEWQLCGPQTPGPLIIIAISKNRCIR